MCRRQPLDFKDADVGLLDRDARLYTLSIAWPLPAVLLIFCAKAFAQPALLIQGYMHLQISQCTRQKQSFNQ
jgi:hypothetical protein